MIWRPWSEDGGLSASFFDKEYSREKIKSKIGAEAPMIVLKQVHSAKVIQVTRENLKQSFEADACVTNLENVALSVHTADCLPLLASEGEIIGACHGGWRGISLGIIENWIAALGALGARKEKIKIAIGPAIGPCHFEVGKDVSKLLIDQSIPAIPAKFASALRRAHDDPTKEFINLRELARFKILRLGVLVQNLTVSEECTYCDKNRYFSYRRDGAQLGRLEAVIIRRAH
jgi:polyphenol oxidase